MYEGDRAFAQRPETTGGVKKAKKSEGRKRNRGAWIGRKKVRLTFLSAVPAKFETSVRFVHFRNKFNV